MRVVADRWHAYRQNHTLVQEAFPDLGDDEREFLLGMKKRMYLCPICWEKTFDLEDDDEPQEEDSPQETVAYEPPQRKVTKMIDPSGLDQTYTAKTLMRERDQDAEALRARWAAVSTGEDAPSEQTAS